MIKSALTAATLAVLASASMAAGNTVDVDFDAYVNGLGGPYYIGSFIGTDTNNDGLISASEVTKFLATPQPGASDPVVTKSTLAGFGDFDIATNTWEADGASWPGQGNIGYFTWNGGKNSINTIDGSVSTTIVSQTAAVPEPATLAMMGLGALALVARRRKSA